MSGSDDITADTSLSPFHSLAALRAAHISLLDQRRSNFGNLAFFDAIAQFIRQGRATGALLDNDDERLSAQSLLDYWSNFLYREGREPPDAGLDPFNPALAPELDDALCPYLGLDSFRETNHRLFFGRKRLVSELVERLRTDRFLAIVGPSGSGKSSLVRAGIVPALKADALPDSQAWHYYDPIVPGSNPLFNLVRVVDPADTTLVQAEDFQRDNAYLATLLENAGNQPSVIVIDQFEEVFTLCDDERARLAFINNLLTLCTYPSRRHILLLTMRSDFETYVTRIPHLYAAFEQAIVRVTPLSASELREAIEKPAELVGLKFETGVVEALLQDILGEPAALPLLQFTLLKLWERRERNRVMWETYRQVGGGRLALARSADSFYEHLIPEEQVTARRILLRLVRQGEGLEITSNRVRRELLYQTGEARDRVDRVLEKLIAARLVRVTEGDTAADTQIEVAHEALVRNWPTLVDWLEEEKIAISTRRRLELKAAEWIRLGQSSSGLLDKVQMHEAERWLGSAEAAYLGYDPQLPLFVQASREAITAAEREEEATRQRELEQARALAQEQQRRAEEQSLAAKRLRWLSLGLIIAILIATTLAITAFWQRGVAVTAQKQAQSLTQAFIALDQSPEQALLIVLTSIPSTPTYEPTFVRALYQAFETAAIRRKLSGHRDWVIAVAWSPDGQHILTGSDDQTARIWDVVTDKESVDLLGHTGKVKAVAWSPDGQQVVTGSADGTARLWDSASGKERMVLIGHTDSVRAVAWSSDGRFIATGSADHTARIWDVATGQSLMVLAGHAGAVRAVAWSPDGLKILTGSDDKTARIWDGATGQVFFTLTAHTAQILAVAWSPDGQQVLTGSADRSTRIWNAQTGEQTRTLRGHTAAVYAVGWSPDKQHILSAGADVTVRIWNLNQGETDQLLKGHTDWILSAAWSPDSRYVVTGSADRTVRIWDVSKEIAETTIYDSASSEDGQYLIGAATFSHNSQYVLTGSNDQTARIWDLHTGQTMQLFRGHTAVVSAVAWSPDGKQVLTGSKDQTVRIWDVATGRALQTLGGDSGEIYAVAWDPDGQHVLTGNGDSTARIWATISGQNVLTLSGHTGAVLTVAWSPDGKHVLTGSVDGSARIWNSETGAVLHELKGHSGSIFFASWSPDGKKILTGSGDNTARIWDAVTGATQHILRGHAGSVLAVAWNIDGSEVLTGSSDSTARIWDSATGLELHSFKGHTEGVWSVAWSPDGQLALTSDEAGIIRFWLVNKSLMIAELTRRVCNLFDDTQIRSLRPNWRGCETELTAIEPGLTQYDQLRNGP